MWKISYCQKFQVYWLRIGYIKQLFSRHSQLVLSYFRFTLQLPFPKITYRHPSPVQNIQLNQDHRESHYCLYPSFLWNPSSSFAILNLCTSSMLTYLHHQLQIPRRFRHQSEGAILEHPLTGLQSFLFERNSSWFHPILCIIWKRRYSLHLHCKYRLNTSIKLPCRQLLCLLEEMHMKPNWGRNMDIWTI